MEFIHSSRPPGSPRLHIGAGSSVRPIEEIVADMQKEGGEVDVEGLLAHERSPEFENKLCDALGKCSLGPMEACKRIAQALAVSRVASDKVWLAVVEAVRNVVCQHRPEALVQLAAMLAQAGMADRQVWRAFLFAIDELPSDVFKSCIKDVAHSLLVPTLALELPSIEALCEAALSASDKLKSGLVIELSSCARLNGAAVPREFFAHLLEVAESLPEPHGGKAVEALEALRWTRLIDDALAPSLTEVEQFSEVHDMASGMVYAKFTAPEAWSRLVTAAGKLSKAPYLMRIVVENMALAKVVDPGCWKLALDTIGTLIQHYSAGKRDASYLRQAADVLWGVRRPMTDLRVRDAACWMALIDAFLNVSGGREQAENLRVLADSMCKVKARDPSCWKRLIGAFLKLTSDGLADEDRKNCLDQIAEQMQKCGVGDESCWAMLVDVAWHPSTGMGSPVVQQMIVRALREARLTHTALGDKCLAILQAACGDIDTAGLLKRLDRADVMDLLLVYDQSDAKVVGPLFKPTLRAMLENVSTTGRLDLLSIEGVREYQQQAMDGAPGIDWAMLSDPSRFPPPRQFYTFTSLAKALDDYASSTRELLKGLLDLHRTSESNFRWELQDVFLPLLGAIGPDDLKGCKKGEFERMLKLTFGEAIDGRITPGPELLERLFVTKGGKTGLKSNVLASITKASGQMAKILAQLHDPEVRPLLESLHGKWLSASSALQQCVDEKNANGQSRYKNSGIYSVSLLDKEAPSTLTLGARVNCCLPPMGGRFDAMLNRILNKAWQFFGVTPLVAGRSQSHPMAAAWCAICTTANKKTVLVVDFTDMQHTYRPDAEELKPDHKNFAANAARAEEGNAIAAELLAYVGEVAKALGVQEVSIGAQRYDRMKKFLTFSKRNYIPVDGRFRILVDDFIEAADPELRNYTDNIYNEKGMVSQLW